jgi:hypothetical protein
MAGFLQATMVTSVEQRANVATRQGVPEVDRTKVATMVAEQIQNYVNLVGGLTRATKSKASDAAKGLLSATKLDDVAADANERVTALAEEIIAASKANRQLLLNLITTEVDKAAGRLGFARAEDVDALRADLAELRATLAEQSARAESVEAVATEATAVAAAAALAAEEAATSAEEAAVSAEEAVSTPPVVKKTTARKSPTKKTAPAKKTATAKTAAATTPAAKKAPAKKTAAKKASARKTPAKKTAASA